MSLDLIPSPFDLERIQLVMSGDFTVKPGWVYGPIHYDNYQVVYFPIGSETRYIGSNKATVLSKPCVLIVPAGETVTFEFDKSRPVRHLFITFNWEKGPFDSRQLAVQPESVCLQSVEETFVPLLMKQIMYLSNKKVYLWEKRCKLLLASALAELEGLQGMPNAKAAPVSDTKHSLPVLKALDYIDRHLEEPITVAQLAREAGWSHEYFTRKFVQYMGMPPQKAIVQRRIERACQLLVQEQLNISEIAYAVGFQNVHYFYRAFANAKGMPASRYRQTYSAPHLKHLSPTGDLEASYPLNRYFYYS
jgi:AraC-like DNA-binding protein